MIKKKIAIFGGAFNPPHVGHAMVVEALERLFDGDEIWLMPTANRADKTMATSNDDRLVMLKLVINEYFSEARLPIMISDLELKRPKLTTTYDTLMELKNLYPDNEFYFVIGDDLVGDIESKWARGKELSKLANFLAIRKSFLPVPKNSLSHLTILDKEIAHLDISSTFVRKLISEGYSGMPYITKEVAEYIKERQLYRI